MQGVNVRSDQGANSLGHLCSLDLTLQLPNDDFVTPPQLLYA